MYREASHALLWTHKPSEGSSAPETIACAIADFIDTERALIRAHVNYIQDKGLENLRAQMQKLGEMAEGELRDASIVEVYSREFMHSVKRFIANLLDENTQQSLRGRLNQLESSSAWLRASLQAQEPHALFVDTVNDYTEVLDQERSIGRELLLLRDALEGDSLNVIAGYPPRIAEHPRWAASPGYLDLPGSLSTSLGKKSSEPH